jgi:hypothetical protein
LLNHLNEDNQLAPPVNRANQERLEALYAAGEGNNTNNGKNSTLIAVALIY